MAAKFGLYKDTKGEWRWRLRHDNGKVIADSGEGYTTKEKALQGIQAVKDSAAVAPIEESPVKA